MKITVRLQFKPEVMDAASQSMQYRLAQLGFLVNTISVGKLIELKIDRADRTNDELEAEIRRICETVLVNPVYETYQFEIKT